MDHLKYILVLGGSTFMGKTLLDELKQHLEFKVLFVNRGRKYWNGESKSLATMDHYFGNRDDHADFNKVITYLNQKYSITKDNKWAAIIDFSAYTYPDIDSVRSAVLGLTELYIFISSDSQYDAYNLRYSPTPIREMDPIKELTPEQKSRAKSKEEYGYNKLKCQIFLRKDSPPLSDFPFISLILPDVIGPYDDTARFWCYVKWLQRTSVSPIQIDDECKTAKSSLVFSKDVVKLIMELILYKEKREGKVGQSYHLAFQQRPTLNELVDLIAEAMEIKPNYQQIKNPSSFYPSVEFGSLDITKAKQMLGWKPTSLKSAVQQTVDFFTKKGGDYHQEDEYAEKKLRKKLKIS